MNIHNNNTSSKSEQSIEDDLFIVNMSDEVTINISDEEASFALFEQNKTIYELEDVSTEDDEQKSLPNIPFIKLVKDKLCSICNIDLNFCPHSNLTPSQRSNRRKRSRRYYFQVTRTIYEQFTITHIKRILICMNIYWVNINVVRNTLYIGLKDDQIRQQVETLLHKKVFTKEHYQRIQAKDSRLEILRH
ncbi:hypothetical protein I4U23_028233 [Adineta vaga]|nr:hypothetical protein I4U23_028233 [Adineta vaga]